MLDLLHSCPPSSKSPAPVQRVRPGLWQLLDAIGDTPALVLGRRTDVLSSNRMANLTGKYRRDSGPTGATRLGEDSPAGNGGVGASQQAGTHVADP